MIAIVSISIELFFGNFETSYAALAGYGSLNNSAIILLTNSKLLRLSRRIVNLIMFENVKFSASKIYYIFSNACLIWFSIPSTRFIETGSNGI